MYTITQESTTKIIIKKSSFIAAIIPTTSKDVNKKIKQFKSHNKATHHPYAYRTTSIEHNKLVTEEKYSDDGEPSKTAGFPLLNILKSQELTNCLIIVARIFGGIKLGPAGLIKAFSESAKEALKQNNIVEYIPTKATKLTITINKLEQLEHQLNKNNISHEKIFSSNKVTLTIEVPYNNKEIRKIIEQFA